MKSKTPTYSSLEELPITIVDVGSLGGASPRWQKFKNRQIVGFEPDEREFEKIQDDEHHLWINTALADKEQTVDFYLYREACNSSIYRPNYDLIERLSYKKEDFDTIKTVQVKTETLDQVCQSKNLSPNYIKLDTQGSELQILQGSEKVLGKSVVVAEIEVEFLPLYKDQPLFNEVNAFMLERDFELIDLGNPLYVKGRNSRHLAGRKSNFVAADGLYFKSRDWIVNNTTLENTEILTSAIPAILSYGYLDYIFEVLTRLRTEKPQIYRAIQALFSQDIFGLLEEKSPRRHWWQISEREYFKIRKFFDRRIKNKPSNWHYGIGNYHE